MNQVSLMSTDPAIINQSDIRLRGGAADDVLDRVIQSVALLAIGVFASTFLALAGAPMTFVLGVAVVSVVAAGYNMFDIPEPPPGGGGGSTRTNPVFDDRGAGYRMTSDVAKEHMQASLDLEATIPDPAPGTRMLDLLDRWDEIRFVTRDAYSVIRESHIAAGNTIETLDKRLCIIENLSNDGHETTKEELRRYLKDFIENVEGRRGHLGVPTSPVKRENFYSKVEKFLKHTSEGFSWDVHPASLLVNLAVAGMHCGGRYMTEAQESYTLVKGGFFVTTFQGGVEEILHTERKRVADAIADEKYREDHASSAFQAHYVLSVLQRVGCERGIRGAGEDVEYDDVFGVSGFSKEEALRRFDELYTRDSIIQLLSDAMNGIRDSDDPDNPLKNTGRNPHFVPDGDGNSQLMNWFRDNRPPEFSDPQYGENDPTGASRDLSDYRCEFMYDTTVDEMLVDMSNPNPKICDKAIEFMCVRMGILKPTGS